MRQAPEWTSPTAHPPTCSRRGLVPELRRQLRGIQEARTHLQCQRRGKVSAMCTSTFVMQCSWLCKGANQRGCTAHIRCWHARRHGANGGAKDVPLAARGEQRVKDGELPKAAQASKERGECATFRPALPAERRLPWGSSTAACGWGGRCRRPHSCTRMSCRGGGGGSGGGSCVGAATQPKRAAAGLLTATPALVSCKPAGTTQGTPSRLARPHISHPPWLGSPVAGLQAPLADGLASPLLPSPSSARLVAASVVGAAGAQDAHIVRQKKGLRCPPGGVWTLMRPQRCAGALGRGRWLTRGADRGSPRGY